MHKVAEVNIEIHMLAKPTCNIIDFPTVNYTHLPILMTVVFFSPQRNMLVTMHVLDLLRTFLVPKLPKHLPTEYDTSILVYY